MGDTKLDIDDELFSALSKAENQDGWNVPRIPFGEISPEAFDCLVQTYRATLIESTQAAKKLVTIIKALNWIGGEPSLRRGKVKLEGKIESIEVDRKINVSFQKEKRGGPHPYEDLIKQYPQLEKYCKVEIKEAGSGVQEMLDNWRVDPDTKDLDELDRRMLEEISRVRVENPGKPGIKLLSGGVPENLEEE